MSKRNESYTPGHNVTTINVRDMSTRQKIAANISYAILGIAFMVAGLFVFWAVQSDNVYDIKEKTIAVDPLNVVAGENVTLKFSICKNIDVEGRVTRTFVSRKTEVSAPSTIDDLHKTCLHDLLIPVPVPGQLEPGEYRIRYLGVYKINPIKTSYEEYYSEPFMVKEKGAIQ